MTTPDQDDPSKKEFLGEIFIRRNLITSAQLTKALEIQKKDNRFLGEILVQLGFIEDRDVVTALVVQCNVPYIAIDKYEIDRNIALLISKDKASDCQVIPLDRVGDVLSVVMVNPLDSSVKAELHRLTGCKIAPFIATKAEIQKAIEHSYREGL